MNNTDISTISSELFKKIANRYNNISMLDKDGKATIDEREAVIFNMMFLPGRKDTLVTINLLNLPDLELTYDRSMVDNFDDHERSDWFNFVSHDLRRFTVQAGINLNIIDLDKHGLSTKDIQAMIEKAKKNQDNSEKDLKESRFSRMQGTKRSSVQVLEKHRIKVRHTDIINDDVRGARSRRIKALYIENNQHERRRFPFLSLEGVRAMARHLEEGGDWNDRLGQHILETTNKSVTIRKFIREVRRQQHEQQVMKIIEQLRERQKHYRRSLILISGAKGYHSYKQNIEECYVEPVSPIEGYFSNMGTNVVAFLPQIERILGEKIVATLEQEVLKEYVNWVNGSVLLEAPQDQPAAAPAASPQNQADVGTVRTKMPALQRPKKFKGDSFKGRAIETTINDDVSILQDLRIPVDNPERKKMLDKQKPNLINAVENSAKNNAFSMPVIFYGDPDTLKKPMTFWGGYKKGEQFWKNPVGGVVDKIRDVLDQRDERDNKEQGADTYFFHPEESIQKTKLLWLLVNYPKNIKNIKVYIVDISKKGK